MPDKASSGSWEKIHYITKQAIKQRYRHPGELCVLSVLGFQIAKEDTTLRNETISEAMEMVNSEAPIWFYEDHHG